MTRELQKWMWICSLTCLTVAFVGCKKDEVKQSAVGAPAPAPVPASVPDVTRAITELSQAWDKVTSFSGTIHTELGQAIEREGRTIGEGTYDLLQTDGGVKIRFELSNTLYIETGWENRAQLATAEILSWVTDGAVMYQSTQQAKKYHKVIKTRSNPDAILQMIAPIVLRKLASGNTLTLLPDEVIDGKKVTVIQALPTNGTWTETHYFDKETGIRVKHIELDKNGKQTYLLTLTDLKTNVEFEDDHFTFEVPEGVELIDKTKE